MNLERRFDKRVFVSGILASLAGAACRETGLTTPTPSIKPEKASKVFKDDGRFPQCKDVKLSRRQILFENPLTAKPPFTAVNPQIRRALESLYKEGIHDVVSADLLPQGTRFRMSGSSVRTFCLPDQIKGQSRFFMQTDVNVGVGLPGGGSEGMVEFELPEGINPIVMTRFAPPYPGGAPELRRWLVFMVEPSEKIIAKNSDGSLTMIGKGPLAMPIEGSEGNRNIEFILPELKFAEDKPIPQQ